MSFSKRRGRNGIDECLREFSETENRPAAQDASCSGQTGKSRLNGTPSQLLREISRKGHVTFSAALAIRVYVFCHSVSIGIVPWKRAPPWCVLSGGVVCGCGVALGFVGQRRWRGSGLSIEQAHCRR